MEEFVLRQYNRTNSSKFVGDLTLEQQIEQELQNYCQNDNFDTTSKYQDDLNSEYDPHYDRASQLNESMQIDFENEAWKDFHRAKQAREEAISKFEMDIRRMQMVNQDEIPDLDPTDEYTDKKKEIKNPIFTQDKLAQIRQKVNEELAQNPLAKETYSDFEEKYNREYTKLSSSQADLNNIIQGENIAEQILMRESMEKASLERTLKNDVETKMERIREERETFKMEAEDKRSRQYETETHRSRFNERLVTLPSSFPVLEDQPNSVNYLGLNFIIPAFETITIEQPIMNPMMNLSDQSRLKLEGEQLKSIKNRGKFKLQTVDLKNKSSKVLVDAKKLLKPSTSHQNKLSENAIGVTKSIKESLSGVLDLKLIGKLICQKISQQSKEIIQKIESTSIKKIIAVAMQSFKEIYQSVQLVVAEKENSRKNQNQEGLDGEEFFNQSIADEGEKSLSTLLDEMKKRNVANASKHDKMLRISFLELKLENISDMRGIESLSNLKFLSLSMNKLQKIENLGKCANLIELNLAQNQIVSMQGIENLKNLRILNLELNKITKIEGLGGCPFLETLKLNNNLIVSADGVEAASRLRSLNLFRNKIKNIAAISRLLSLEDLDLGRNEISDIRGLEKCILLRKLVLYFNQIAEIPKGFSHPFLVELYLNGNQLSTVDTLEFLPSLELLNLERNKLMKLTNVDRPVFLPNLKSLIVSYNQIQDFHVLLAFCQSCSALAKLDFRENPCESSLPESKREFYYPILLNKLPKLSELNNQNRKNYAMYAIDAKIATHEKPYQLAMNPLSSMIVKFSAYLTEYRAFSNWNSARFDSLLRFGVYRQTLETYLQMLPPRQFKEFSESKEEENPFLIDHNLSHNFFNFRLKLQRSLVKLRSLLVRVLYKLRKRRKHFQKNIRSIIKIQAFYRGYMVRRNVSIRKIRDQKLKQKEFEKLAVYAIKIQRAWKRYLFVKRKKKLFSKVKYEDDELDNLEEDDFSMFDKGPNLDQYELSIPKAIQSIISQPQHFPSQPQSLPSQPQMISKQPEPASQKKMQVIREEPDFDEEFKMNSRTDLRASNLSYTKQSMDRMNESRTSLDTDVLSVGDNSSQKRTSVKPPVPVKKKGLDQDEKEAIMKDWGFQDPKTMKALEFKIMKNKSRATKKENMTAEERLQMFKKNAGKR